MIFITLVFQTSIAIEFEYLYIGEDSFLQWDWVGFFKLCILRCNPTLSIKKKGCHYLSFEFQL